jgi:MFS family permease
MNLPIPYPDPMPLPAPLWLLRTLLLLTFFLHVLFMNSLLGGTAVAMVCAMRRKSSPFSARLADDLGRLLPSILAFTITLGVAPLLFLQVMYGQLLYTSSILLGVPWLAIIGIVILAYYGVYYFSLKGREANERSSAVLVLVLMLLASVAFIYSNNFTLMLAPERWMNLYRSHASGWNLNWSEPSLPPRYLHFVLGALAVSGLGLVVLALRQREDAYRKWLTEQGFFLFTFTTLINFAVGFWFLLKLPGSVQLDFVGGNGFATVLLGIGVLLPLAAVAHLIMAKSSRSPRRALVIGVSCGLLTVAAMIVMRDVLRNLQLAPNFSPGQLPVAPQWSIIALFAVLFLAGLATVYYMLRKVASAARMQIAANVRES